METFQQDSQNFLSSDNTATFGEYKVTSSTNGLKSETSAAFETQMTQDNSTNKDSSISFSQNLPLKVLPPIYEGEINSDAKIKIENMDNLNNITENTIINANEENNNLQPTPTIESVQNFDIKY